MTKRLPAPSDPVEIVDLAHDGRGVARLDGRVVFVAGGLPGELVRLGPRHRRAGQEVAQAVEVLKASPDRAAPPCEHFGNCGGCALQHLAPAAQLAAKDRELRAVLERIGRVTPAERIAPLTGPVLGYRRRARLGVKYVTKKGRVLVGFRERDSPYLVDVRRCHVLVPALAALVEPLGDLVGTLALRERIPQIEVAAGERPDGSARVVLVLRVLEPPGTEDRARLREWGVAHGVEFWLQPGGLDTAAPLDPPAGTAEPLVYRLAAFDLTLEFSPLDFVQVNGPLNARMVAHALEWLAPGPGDAVLDLYCGLGNFTLPIAQRAGRVFGVEGEAGLVERARSNAAANGIGNAEFAVADLSADLHGEPWARQRWDRVLLDPPRVGAREALPVVAASGAARVVYISCHPGSLARDAGLLVHGHGFRLRAAGIMDMFPHTAHVESIAVFERP